MMPIVTAQGRPWIILASGPSQHPDDIETVRKYRREHGAVVVAINNQVFAAPWADVLYSCDSSWWRHYGDAEKSPSTARVIREFAGEKLSIDPLSLQFGARVLRREPGEGLGRHGIRTGNNSGYQCLNLAWHRGARHVILLGYDMQHTGGRAHSHQDHPPPLGNFCRDMAVLCARKFDTLSAELRAEGVRVMNCTRETALRCFDRMSLADALASLKRDPGESR